MFNKKYLYLSGNKKKWFDFHLNVYNLKVKKFLNFYFFSNEDDWEMIEFFFPFSIRKIKDFYFHFKNEDADVVDFFYQKKIKDIFEMQLLLPIVPFLINNKNFDIEFKIIDKGKIYISFLDVEKNIIREKEFLYGDLNSVHDFLKEFEYAEIKLSKKAIENIKTSVLEKFLFGYDINFKNYNVKIEKNDEEIYDIFLINSISRKKIKISNAKINEKNGDVIFAGIGNDLLIF